MTSSCRDVHVVMTSWLCVVIGTWNFRPSEGVDSIDVSLVDIVSGAFRSL